MKTAAESRVAVVTQLMLETEASRSFWMRPRIGMGRVCIIDTTMAAMLSARTTTVSFLWPAAAGGLRGSRVAESFASLDIIKHFD